MASLTPVEQKGDECTLAPEPERAVVTPAKRKYDETLESSAFAPDSEAYRLLHRPLQKPRRRTAQVQAGPAPSQRPAQRLRSIAWEIGKKKIESRENARTFHYSKLENDEIRILHLQPGSGSDPLKAYISKRKLKDAWDRYEALSYTWGAPEEKASETISIRDLNTKLEDFNDPHTFPLSEIKGRRLFILAVHAMRKLHIGNTFHIRRNLYQALLRLRRKDSIVNLWVDAICINQSQDGMREKADQLAMMAEIYRSAANVCIWLGEEFEAGTEGCQLIRQIMNLREFDSLMATPTSKSRWMQLIQMMKAPWFSRRWVIQEIAFSRSATIHCANEILHWDDFSDAVSLLSENITVLRARFQDEMFHNLEANSAYILVHTLANAWQKSHDLQRSKMLDLETLVSTLLAFNSSFARDTIYAILSLARDPPEENEPWLHLHQVAPEDDPFATVKIPSRWPGSSHALSTDSVFTFPPVSTFLKPNYEVSTRDIFIAFVTRCILQSGQLDIICRHWAPPVRDQQFGDKVSLPSSISEMSKAPFGIPGLAIGRQNGENFVAYSPDDRIRRYNAAGASQAEIYMVEDLSSCFLRASLPRNAAAMFSSGQFNLEQLACKLFPEDSREKALSKLSRMFRLLLRMQHRYSDIERDHVLSDVLAVTGFVVGDIVDCSETMNAGVVPGNWIQKMGWRDNTNFHLPSATVYDDKIASKFWYDFENISFLNPNFNSNSRLYINWILPDSDATLSKRPIPDILKQSLNLDNLDLRFKGTISDESSNQMSLLSSVIGGILRKEKLSNRDDLRELNFTSTIILSRLHSDRQDSVPETIWRLLVADRTSSGIKSPQWYKRALLDGLMHPAITDSYNNFHFQPLGPQERKVPEMTIRYLNRVKEVVWNRRIVEIKPQKQFVEVGLPDRLFGLAPEGTTVGDRVCILHGCSVPVVLSKIERIGKQGDSGGDLNSLVGEAYVHGIMDGEAVKDSSVIEPLKQEFHLA